MLTVAVPNIRNPIVAADGSMEVDVVGRFALLCSAEPTASSFLRGRIVSALIIYLYNHPFMIRLKLQTTEGSIVWHSPMVSSRIRGLSPFWSVAAETFASDMAVPSIFDSDNAVALRSATTGTIHGRSCYLGFDKIEKRHYFTKGVGWIWSTGWQPQDGSYGVLPLWAAERERDLSWEFAKLGIDVVRPEAIFLHGFIPDAQGNKAHSAETILDLDGTPAKPCMYIYSSSTRWRIADLAFLTKKERNTVLPKDKPQWLFSLLTKLGRSCRTLHRHGGYDYSLSPHNSFIDGTRLDFEYAVLPSYPHKNKMLNEKAETWQGKELNGLREIAWHLADMMRLDITGQELNRWWSNAYNGNDTGLTSVSDFSDTC